MFPGCAALDEVDVRGISSRAPSSGRRGRKTRFATTTALKWHSISKRPARTRDAFWVPDHSLPFQHNWPGTGKSSWCQYDQQSHGLRALFSSATLLFPELDGAEGSEVGLSVHLVLRQLGPARSDHEGVLPWDFSS